MTLTRLLSNIFSRENVCLVEIIFFKCTYFLKDCDRKKSCVQYERKFLCQDAKYHFPRLLAIFIS